MDGGGGGGDKGLPDQIKLYTAKNVRRRCGSRAIQRERGVQARHFDWHFLARPANAGKTASRRIRLPDHRWLTRQLHDRFLKLYSLEAQPFHSWPLPVTMLGIHPTITIWFGQ